MAKLLKIAKTKDVPPGQAAAFAIEGQKVALFNVEGTYYAIGDTCTHRGGPLSEGDVQGTRVTCPWHGADFDLKTGAVLGPPAHKFRKPLILTHFVEPRSETPGKKWL